MHLLQDVSLLFIGYCLRGLHTSMRDPQQGTQELALRSALSEALRVNTRLLSGKPVRNLDEAISRWENLTKKGNEA